MLALIKHELIDRKRGFLHLLRRFRYVRTEESEIAGLKMLLVTVYVPRDAEERELEKIKNQTLSALSDSLVGTVCLHRDFPCPDWFTGFRRPDGRTFARRLVTKQTLSQSGETLLVSARRLDGVVSSAVRLYCRRFRYVMVSSPDLGTEEFAARLTEASGASVMANPTDRRILTADWAAVYDMPQKRLFFDEKCTVIAAKPEYASMTAGGKIARSPALFYPDGTPLTVPEGFSEYEIFGEAVLRGTLNFENILCELR